MNRLCYLLVALSLFTFTGRGLFAEEKVDTGNFVVSFSADAKQKSWVVNALELNIYNDLSGYGKLVPFKKENEVNTKCKNREIECILDIYKILNVDVLMLGLVDDSYIDYEMYDVQNNFLVKTGSIEIGNGSSLLKLRMGAFSAFKPFIEKGGILDKRKYHAMDDNSVTIANEKIVGNNSIAKLKKQVLIFIACFSCFPYLLSFIGKPRRHPERLKIVLCWFYPFQIVSLLVIGYQYMLVDIGAENIFTTILNQFDGFHWLITGLGGIIWGYFVIINFRIVIPHLQGIERIKPNNLFPLLRSCLVTIIIKTLIITVFYLGFFSVVLYLGNLFSMSQEIIILFLFPISGLYIFCWIGLVLDVFSMSIDVRLSSGKLDFKHVWNVKIRKYFISYLKRNGVTLNKRLVDDIVFLPGQNKGVVCYGGGFSRPRITIEKSLIKFALGDIDETDFEATGKYYKRDFEPAIRQNSVFQILANISSQNTTKKWFKSRRTKKRVIHLENVQEFFQRDLNLQTNTHNDQVKNVIQGVVFPKLEGKVDLPSLMSDNVEDMQIVEALIQENSLTKDRYDEDAEIDDSSEQDKDFLFGAILQKFGGLLRHEDIFSTIYQYFSWKKGPQQRAYNFLFSKFFAVVADTFVVLNFGLNNLMQQLYYQATNTTAYLTTKGTASGMLKSQDKILTSVNELISERKKSALQTDELDRIIWLSGFCQDPIEARDQSNNQAGLILKWSVFVGVTYLASLAVINSYDYHPRYLQTIESEKLALADAIKIEQEKERKEK